jgi:hypothetical protein
MQRAKEQLARPVNITEQLIERPIEQRMEEVAEVLATINENTQSIRMSRVKRKPHLAWGVVVLDNLPYGFTAFYNGIVERKIQYLATSNQDRPNPNEPTSAWSPYAPVPLPEYVPPIPNDPGLAEEEIAKARALLTAKHDVSIGDRYKTFREQYQNDPMLRAKYSAAVQLACNTRMTEE